MAQVPNQQSLKFDQLAGRFVKSAALSIPLYAIVTALLLSVFTAFIFQGQPDGGWWKSITQWSLTATSFFLGLLGGALFGMLSSAKKTLHQLEEQLRWWFHQLPPGSQDHEQPPRTIQEVRSHYKSMLGEALASTIGRVPLAGFVFRLIRSKMEQAILDDFIASLEQRGVSHVGSHEFRNWMLTKGLSLGLERTYNQLSFWRYIIIGLLGVFLAGSVGIAHLSR
ncbi:hypothetical protein [Petrachloros mirabilis]